MSSGEYQALMKEMGYTSSSSSSRTGSNNNNTTSHSTNAADDIFLGQITLRLDEKWERFVANLALQTLELARTVVQSLQIVAWAASATLVLYGVARVIQALRNSNDASTKSSSTSSDTDSGETKKKKN